MKLTIKSEITLLGVLSLEESLKYAPNKFVYIVQKLCTNNFIKIANTAIGINLTKISIFVIGEVRSR